MSDNATSSAVVPPRVPALIVMGRDEQGKPHASSFAAEELDLALKAAELMGLHHLIIGDDEAARALALKLPAGRIFSSGKAFTPYVKKLLYSELCALAGVSADASPPPKPGKAAPSVTAEQKGQVPPDLPGDWAAIGVGSLVLAATEPSDGFWLSKVIEAQPDDLFVLRWVGWPQDPTFARRRDQLALLPQNPAMHA